MLIETTRKAVYAAIGAPLVAAKRANERFEAMSKKAKDTSDTFMDDARKEFEAWAEEGEKLLARLQDQPMVEDFSARIDDMPEQVGKLRDQLEDMLANWRKNFAPTGGTAEKVAIEVEEVASVAEKPAAKAAAAKKPAAKKPAAKKPATKAPAAKKPAAKKPAAKKPAAKKPAAKATASK